MPAFLTTDQSPRQASLEDKWIVDRGRIVLNGTQAIVRVLLAQHVLDRQRGLNTAGYISGYRGSPLGNLDTALWSVQERLKEADVLFHPGVNEDIAATAVRGTQQLDFVPGATRDGVFAAWYGKGPGVDRSGDAFKHGNYAGTHPNGGVLVFVGDDHPGKSSTVAHQSEQALAANLIPCLYPSNPGEILHYGLLGFSLSRSSGLWIGIKCVNEVVEQSASINIDLPGWSQIVLPEGHEQHSGLHIQQGIFNPLRDEQIVIERRLPMLKQLLAANSPDRTIFRARHPRLGIVTAGKTYGDVRLALSLLDLDEARARELGLSLYKVGCIWPLEQNGIEAFADSHSVLFVIEEKKSFLEQQIASYLINRERRPLLIGKIAEDGTPLLSSYLSLEPSALAVAIADRLERLGILDDRTRAARTRVMGRLRNTMDAVGVKRSPYFCSGCPHNRSTQIPIGSISMTGIGCHSMINLMRPDLALAPTHMGAEGSNWLGLAPFTSTKHIFQNMGDGTYFHSGLLAIRAAVASRVNITYKILYNDAVAMTGGQPVDGPISVAEIAQQVRHEGVKHIVIMSDDPDRHRNTALPSDVRVHHRDQLDNIQRELREMPGCTVLIYEQTCAVKKRRHRKRAKLIDPPKRFFISEDVCEGCGDCSVQSTCVSLMPVETALGIKRTIDQSSCNKDYSCANGFCPSFITVHSSKPQIGKFSAFALSASNELPAASCSSIEHGTYNIMLAGIGGTGIVTVGALIGMAAHIDGLASSVYDMTGLAQKNGTVYSHIRIARSPEDIHTQRLGHEEADVLLAFDLVAALAPEAASTVLADRTRVVANIDVSPTATFQFDRNSIPSPALLLNQLHRRAGETAVATVDATNLALALLGDTIGANLMMVGMAAQLGALPVSTSAIESAIRLNGTAVDLNINAFRLGRLIVLDPDRVTTAATKSLPPARHVPSTLAEVVRHRMEHLTVYQNHALASRFEKLVDEVHKVEQRLNPGSEVLTLTVARNYAGLLAYKDEYEVARLLTSPTLQQEIRDHFGPSTHYSFNLAPPFLSAADENGRSKKRAFPSWIRFPLKALATLRTLRGTPLDPFGWSADRRLERSLASEYELLVARLLPQITPLNFEAGVELLGAIGEVRGFGHIKAAAAEAYREKLVTYERAFRSSNVPDLLTDLPDHEMAGAVDVR